MRPEGEARPRPGLPRLTRLACPEPACALRNCCAPHLSPTPARGRRGTWSLARPTRRSRGRTLSRGAVSQWASLQT